MTETTKEMRKMLKLMSAIQDFPGVDEDLTSSRAAGAMRKTVAEGLSDALDGVTEQEMYEEIKRAEDKMMDLDEVDDSSVTDGEARMLCQIVLVEKLLEDTQ